MEIVFEIWLRVFEVYAQELFIQESSSGVFSFMIIGVLAYLYKQEKNGQEKKCSCCRKEREKEQTDESS
ncbi:hypothetical protein [Sutcliffiella halmapala]|uniref:hypothetical protein n=1 Tax=Sutcliffiella halmapala TaxID=79882 RepID=UPI00099504FD|nr:hypothetical protein [Sutcliffiella halmapala]